MERELEVRNLVSALQLPWVSISGKVPTTPYHSDDANDANCISCITTPQKSPPTQPQKTFHPSTLLPQHVPSLRVPFAGHPPKPPNYSLRLPSTTQLAPSTKAGFRNCFCGMCVPTPASCSARCTGALVCTRILACLLGRREINQTTNI